MASKPERFARLAVWGVALAVCGALLLVVGKVFTGGVGKLSLAFLTQSPEDAGRAGGILPVLVSTVLVLSTCLAVALPIGLGTAVYLSELTREGGRLGRGVRASLDVLAGVPSIVFGLFGASFFCQVLGLGFSLLAGGLTLACMVLPIFIRIVEQGLRAVPHEQRLAAAALGLSQATTLGRVVLPAAMPAVGVGLVLGIGRALAETAALLFTSGYVDRMPSSLFDSGRVLSVHVYDLAMNVPGGDANAQATALVLLILLAAANGCALALGRRWGGGSP